MRVNNNSVRQGLFFCGRFFFSFVFSSLALLAIGVLIPKKWGNYSQKHCNLNICISNTGIHSNIIVPIKNHVFDWYQNILIDKIGRDTINNYNYLSFGWGDRDFYMSTPSITDLKLSTTFKALFLPTPSVMDVKVYQSIPNYLEVKCIKVNQTDYLRLMEFIQASFKVDAKGSKIRLGDGHTKNTGFYAANGSYSILKTCNSWTAEGLRKANANTPLWDGLSFAIMWHLRSSCD
ncbi:TIGR02117 family protein [Komarekiella sp. 'clone 1']|uniref:TIGR02117 family protein n=1 Tax=Komarekiella delphini-convector SJRDD-AB1 TaxID=2593771 RepID=A0AA40T1T7_9NOST|nr:TIGR02117 family protein [Komarekiella delphini-convector]MBD6619356.1 TIGR02117 family protein [Komarekiella delphini-convector SJRDD-AB1]